MAHQNLTLLFSKKHNTLRHFEKLVSYLGKMEISIQKITQQIYFIRNLKVMLDRDVAALFEIDTGALNRTARRHSNRFPSDFVFKLDKSEVLSLNTSIGQPLLAGGTRKLPLVYTEQGVTMMSCLLNSPQAAAISVAVFRAFANAKGARSETLLEERFAQLEDKLEQSKNDFAAFRQEIQFLQNSLTSLLEKRSPSLLPSPLQQPRPDLQAILITVAQYFKINVKDLFAQNRRKSISLPRQIAIYLIREKTALPYIDIALHLKRDHTTILHA